MTIADTDFFIDAIHPARRHHAGALGAVDEAETAGRPILMTVLTRFELGVGVRLYHDPRKEATRVEEAVRRFPALQLTAEAAERAADVQGRLESEGKAIGPLDALIAGIALQERMPVLTRNLGEFGRVPGLDVMGY